MSRITVVLFHLVLTAAVTVWANSEYQSAQMEQSSAEDLLLKDHGTGFSSGHQTTANGVSAVSHLETQTGNQSSQPEEDLMIEPAI